MATPAMAPIPRTAVIDLSTLCERCAEAAGLRGRAAKADMLAALGGIANLYCEYALASNQLAFRVPTKRGFISEAVSEDEIRKEIAAATGITDRERTERILRGLEAGLRTEMGRYPKGAAIEGFGRWIPSEAGLELAYEQPLARALGLIPSQSMAAGA